ncbi:hypothetical protein RvY_14708 [Ramazzottius varieornatus]|uniref:Zinc transporter ZIP3 n=1 Tax=Ramazzottius varieornatus TaxID=947166 RepID=A0A1D1VW07_RAMVA|nr:hypothetical protein RvY_14708 [Ramazzottius varieornatus]
MELAAAHIVTVLSMFVSCFLTCLVPSVIHIHAEANSWKKRLLSRLKSYSNCVSGGVFAGAFFTQYYPHVVHEFEEIFADTSIWRHPMQLGPSLVFLGFLLTALLERIVDVIMHRFKKRGGMTTARRAPDQELVSTNSRGPLLLDDVSDEEGTVEADAVQPEARFSALAKEEDLDFKVIHSSTTSSNSSHNHNHNHSHGHHHHHHHHEAVLDDYQGITRFVVFVTSLGAHSIFEGLALGLIKDVDLLITMFTGVIAHEILMGLAIGISLARQKMELRSKILFCFIFSVIIPLGQGIGLLVQQADHSSVNVLIVVLQALAAGTFLHVMFLEILPQEMHNHFGIVEAFWVAVGYYLIPLSSLATGDYNAH